MKPLGHTADALLRDNGHLTRREPYRTDQHFQCPQFNPQMVNNVFGDTSAYIGVMDPLGVAPTLDAGLYEALLEQLANEIARCTDA